jgi:hypothetical protein
LRDTHYPLRRAINTVLSGNITYNGQPVKLYDEKRKVADTDNVYIIFSTQQTAISQPIDESWITDELITLEILQKTGFEVTKDFIDDLSDQVYRLLMPTRLNDALPDPTLMQIQLFELDSAISRSVEISETQTIISKIVTFSCKIVQQS